ncbi:hypothetical protein GGR34_003702 [Microvirga flocculans]|uniref:Uncharacterized protein n=1 Tax=Microvirga flocculans TaxID=217168 RepID=A0A7W6N9R9_9HYPH|nr:hypothetical protein [Microvirga flocculans]MBB4042017.1 hypothetical protein [Microvirga flocculans]
MSLVSFAIRICGERALVGKTYAEDRVYDSQIVPVDQTVPTESEPMIILSTDDDKSDVREWDLLRGSRELEVVFEMVLATFVLAKGKNGEQEIEIKIPHTDSGMEASLGFMQRQVMRALMDPLDPWAELFKEFTGRVIRTMGRRGASSEQGVRFAAKQLVLVCDPIPEPDFGEKIPPDSPWGRLIALMEADPNLVIYAQVLREEIENGDDLPSWRRFQASRGWTEARVRNAAFAPADRTETGEAKVMTEGVLERGAMVTVIDEDSDNPLPPED